MKFTGIDFEITLPKETSKIQIEAIRKALLIIKAMDILSDSYEFKKIEIKKVSPQKYIQSYALELLTTVGLKEGEYVFLTSRQIFIGRRGGFSAYHGPKTKRHGVTGIYFSSCLSIF